MPDNKVASVKDGLLPYLENFPFIMKCSIPSQFLSCSLPLLIECSSPSQLDWGRMVKRAPLSGE